MSLVVVSLALALFFSISRAYSPQTSRVTTFLKVRSRLQGLYDIVRTHPSIPGQSRGRTSPLRLCGWTAHDGLLVEDKEHSHDVISEPWEEVYVANGIDGFRADYFKQQDGKITDMGEAGIYGEILPTGIRNLYDSIDLKEDDVLYDLGSGTGKVPIQFASETNCGKCHGIELGEARYKASMTALDLLKKSGDKAMISAADRVTFSKGDILAVAGAGPGSSSGSGGGGGYCWASDATVLFVCATAFPPALLAALVSKIKTECASLRCLMLFTGQDDGDPKLLDTASKRWRFTEQLCGASWDDCNTCHLYQFDRSNEVK